MSLQLIKDEVFKIGRNFEEFTATLEKSKKEQDALIDEKMKKLADDITARHELIQKQLNDLEAKGQRPGQSGDQQEKAKADAVTFRKHWSSITERRIDHAPDDAAVERYQKAWLRYARVDKDRMDPEEIKDLQVGTDPSGGYWITPPTITNNIVRRIFETSPIRNLAQVVTIGTREYIIPEDPNDVGAGWVGETGPITNTTTMQVNRRVITAFEEYAQPAITTQMLEDAAVDIETYLANKIADKMTRVQNTAFVNGTGVNQPRGLLTYPAGATWGQIQQIGTGTSGAFTYNGLVNLITSIKDAFQANAQFLIRRQSVASIMELTDTNGRLIFQPLINGAFNRTPLLGYPINYAADMPAVGAGALALAFGDFREGYNIVDRVGFSTIRDNLTAKPNVLFYTRTRVGGDVVNFDAFVVQVLT